MAQDPNVNGDGANDNAPPQLQQPNGNGLANFLRELQGLTMEKLQPLKLSKSEMNTMIVGDLNNWIFTNLDQFCHAQYRARGNKTNKIEWLVAKIAAVNADRAEMLKNLEAVRAAKDADEGKEGKEENDNKEEEDDDAEMQPGGGSGSNANGDAAKNGNGNNQSGGDGRF